jgi:hypothetical protein
LTPWRHQTRDQPLPRAAVCIHAVVYARHVISDGVQVLPPPAIYRHSATLSKGISYSVLPPIVGHKGHVPQDPVWNPTVELPVRVMIGLEVGACVADSRSTISEPATYHTSVACLGQPSEIRHLVNPFDVRLSKLGNSDAFVFAQIKQDPVHLVVNATRLLTHQCGKVGVAPLDEAQRAGDLQRTRAGDDVPPVQRGGPGTWRALHTPRICLTAARGKRRRVKGHG